jgi:hypothetical protein
MINLKALSKAVFDGQNIRGLEDPVILDSLWRTLVNLNQFWHVKKEDGRYYWKNEARGSKSMARLQNVVFWN